MAPEDISSNPLIFTRKHQGAFLFGNAFRSSWSLFFAIFIENQAQKWEEEDASRKKRRTNGRKMKEKPWNYHSSLQSPIMSLIFNDPDLWSRYPKDKSIFYANCSPCTTRVLKHESWWWFGNGSIVQDAFKTKLPKAIGIEFCKQVL